MLDLLFPTLCTLCQRQGRAVCIQCLRRLPPAPDLAPPPGFAYFASLLSYEGDTKRLIAAIKFDHNRRAITLPGQVLARLIDWQPDRITWAPTSVARRRDRGFDQAEVLARVLAKAIGVECVQLLTRSAGSGHQTGRNRAERLSGAEFICRPTRESLTALGKVLIIDDIRTTGATLCAAGDALLEAGVESVGAATLAVTL